MNFCKSYRINKAFKKALFYGISLNQNVEKGTTLDSKDGQILFTLTLSIVGGLT